MINFTDDHNPLQMHAYVSDSKFILGQPWNMPARIYRELQK